METKKDNVITLGNGITFVPNDEAALRATMYIFTYDGQTGYIYPSEIPASGGYIYFEASKWLSVKSVDGGSPVSTPYTYSTSLPTLTFGNVYDNGHSIYIQPNFNSAYRMASLIWVQDESGKSVAILIRQKPVI